MKKALPKTTFRMVLIFLTVWTTGSCIDKENEEPLKEDTFYLTFKVGGVEKKYTALPNSMASFFYMEEAKIYGGQISGIKNIHEPTRDFVTIQLVNEALYQPNLSYQLQNAVVVDLISHARVIFTYADENGKVYNASLLKDRYLTLNITDEAEVRFIEMGSDYVKGVFSARVYATEFITLTNREELLITDGEFYLPRNDAPNYR